MRAGRWEGAKQTQSLALDGPTLRKREVWRDRHGQKTIIRGRVA